MGDYIAVTDAMKDAAGLIVWWELSGNVDYADMEEQCQGALEAWLPKPPSLDVALSRAAQASLPSKRHLLRPLSKRGAWEVVREEVVAEGVTGEELSHHRVLSGFVEHLEDGERRVKIVPVSSDEAHNLCDVIVAKLSLYQKVLTATDMSSWMLGRALAIHAVGLRQRGGFYFIPKDRVDDWHRVVEVVRAVSGHMTYEMPCMRTEEAVEAIFSSVRAEANAQLEGIEDWLMGETCSTRGLNAYERQVEEVKAKIRHYCDLLGQQESALEGRLEKLTGMLQAARIVAEAPEDPEAC